MRSAELRSPGTAGLMRYRDAEGNVTERRIRVIRSCASRNGVRYIEAFCSLKHEERTFRADRVLSFEADPSGPVPRPAAQSPRGDQTFAPSFRPVPVLAAARASRPDLPASEREKAPYFSGAVGRFFEHLLPVFLVGAFGFILLCGAGSLASKWFSPRKKFSPASYFVPAVRPAVNIPKTTPAAATTVPAAKAAIPRKLTAEELRRRDFAKTTGIADFRLLRLYEAADLNGDGNISWDELASFQKELKRNYTYKTNGMALRPDEFLRQGGGDCEDWALVTCGLLRYWGIASYVGVFNAPTRDCGHAVALVHSPDKPGDKPALEAKGILSFQGVPIPDGFYVPVDYEVVGGLSDAVGPGYAFAGYHVPERIYGARM